MTGFFEKSDTLLVVAAKCGITTFNHTLQQYAIEEPEHLDIDAELEHYDRIIISMRDPLSRLLSAWRMFFVARSQMSIKQISRLLPGPLLKGKHRKLCDTHPYYRSIQPWQSYLQNPQREFDKFCESKLANRLVKHDPHFWPQHCDYDRYFDLPNTVYVDSISSILHYFNCEPVILNEGQWPWPSLTLNDFSTSTVQSFLHRYYARDLHTYSLCEKL